MSKRDIIIGCLLLLFGLFWGGKALTYDYQSPYGPGPGFLPFWLSLLLIGLSLLLIFPALKSYRAGDREITHENTMFTNPLILLKSLGVLFMIALFLETAGFMFIIAMATTFYVKLVRPEHLWKRSVIIGAIISILIYIAFKYILGLNIPRGVLPL